MDSVSDETFTDELELAREGWRFSEHTMLLMAVAFKQGWDARAKYIEDLEDS